MRIARRLKMFLHRPHGPLGDESDTQPETASETDPSIA